jgi:hypothetical protein
MDAAFFMPCVAGTAPNGTKLKQDTNKTKTTGKEKGVGSFRRQLLVFIVFSGRDGVIRTLDPLHPMQVRYQAALRPDWRKIIPEGQRNVAGFAAHFLTAATSWVATAPGAKSA